MLLSISHTNEPYIFPSSWLEVHDIYTSIYIYFNYKRTIFRNYTNIMKNVINHFFLNKPLKYCFFINYNLMFQDHYFYTLKVCHGLLLGPFLKKFFKATNNRGNP